MTRLTTDITNVQMAYMFYDPSARKSADHDRDVPDHDGDDQSCDRIYDVDHDSGFGRTFDLYRKESAPAFLSRCFDEYDELNNVVQENATQPAS